MQISVLGTFLGRGFRTALQSAIYFKAQNEGFSCCIGFLPCCGDD